MGSTSPAQTIGLHRFPITAPQRTSLELPANAVENSGRMAGMVVKAVDAQLFRILLLQVQSSILLKTSMPLKQGQIIELVRDGTGGYQAVKITLQPLEVISQTLRHALPMQQPLVGLLNKWLVLNLALPGDQSSSRRQSSAEGGSTEPRFSGNSSDIQRQLANLIRHIPAKQQLQQPAAIKDQIHNNGIFHESAGRKARRQDNDLKGSLIRIKRHVEGSIKNMERSQKPDPAARSSGEDSPRPADSGNRGQKADTGFPEVRPVRRPAAIGTPARGAPAADASERGTSAPSAPRPGPPVPGVPVRSAVPDEADDGSKGQNVKVQQTPTPLSGLRNLLLETHQAIARIQAFQLQSLSQQLTGQERNQWFMEIPVRSDDHIDVFNLQISEEPLHYKDEHSDSGVRQSASPSQQQKKWSIRLEFDLPGLGPMAANVVIVDKSVSLSIWAEQQSTYETATSHLGELESKLRDWQLDLENISCHKGTDLPQAAGPYTTQNEHLTDGMFQFDHLIDLKT